MKDSHDWDKALRDLVRAEKGYVANSHLSHGLQDDLKELCEGLHHGCEGGVFVRLKDGSIRYLFIGRGDDPDFDESVDKMLLELIEARLKRRKDA